MKAGRMKKVLQIKGMTCTSCEMRIENELKKLDGIVEAKAMYSSSNVYVTYNPDQILLDTIIDAIENLDYKVQNKPFQETQKDTAKEDKLGINQMLGIGIIILALYVIIKNTIGFNYIPEVNASMGYGILFVVGLLTSLHCIAMCGGINLSQCISPRGGELGNLKEGFKFDQIKPSLMYNGGRVISYTIIGGLVGALGSVVSFSGTAKGVVAILSGAFMVIMGLNMLQIFPWLRKLNPRMPKIFRKKINGSPGKKGPLVVGLLNGLMPCGPLQAMQLYALGTGSFFAGALSMFLFSLGTVPLMFGFGAASSLLSRKFTHHMLRVSAVLVMILGVVMVNRGLNLSGINASFAAPGSGSIATIDQNVQRVTTTMESGRYTPIVVQKGIPVKWTIKAEKSDLNGCNNPVTIPKYNIEKKLVPGDNIIEFTPNEEGSITYTCWMGMISSSIQVVGDISKVSDQDISSSGDPKGDSYGGGCCSAGSKATAFENGNIPTDEIAIGKIENGKQRVRIAVNEYGFIPAVVVIQKGIPTEWVIEGEVLNSCNNALVFPEYNSRVNLKEGENKIDFVPEQDFSFQCWMGMLNGYVKVVDDINTLDLEEIRKGVESFQPAGSGGCCG